MAVHLKSARVERWPVAGRFIISRGATDHVDVVVAEVEGEGATGRGEGTPVYYLGEDAVGCRDQLLRVAPYIAEMSAAEARAAVQELMPPGAARNAIDCALWDLEAKQRGLRLWQLAGCDGPPTARTTAYTISLGTPGAMAEQAATAEADGYRLLKIKLTGEGDRLRVGAELGALPVEEGRRELGLVAGDVDLPSQPSRPAPGQRGPAAEDRRRHPVAPRLEADLPLQGRALVAEDDAHGDPAVLEGFPGIARLDADGRRLQAGEEQRRDHPPDSLSRKRA